MTIFEVALHQNDRQAASTRITPAVAATGSEWDHAPALDVPSVEHWLAVSLRGGGPGEVRTYPTVHPGRNLPTVPLV